MASVRQLESKSGKYVYELRVTDNGRSLSKRFTVPDSYSKARAQREAESAAAVLEADFKAGKDQGRAKGQDRAGPEGSRRNACVSGIRSGVVEEYRRQQGGKHLEELHNRFGASRESVQRL